MSDPGRRALLVLLAMGLAPARAQAALAALARGRRQFFSARQHRLVETMVELILPADGRSPGAREAGVAGYVDLVVAHSAPAVQRRWRRGLAALDQLARARGGAAFADLDAAGQALVLDTLAMEEPSPETDAGRFFVDVKTLTLKGYYTSEIGVRRELGYLGPEALGDFPGCAPTRGTDPL